MKRMKRVVVGLLALGMAFTMTACGGKEQTVTYRKETETNGAKMTDTVTYTAKGDIIEKQEEIIVIDLSSLDDATKDQFNSSYEDLIKQYNDIDGVNSTMTSDDNSTTVNIDVDMTGNAVKELTDKGHLTVSGGDGSGKISLKASAASLESSGYEKVE